MGREQGQITFADLAGPHGQKILDSLLTARSDELREIVGGSNLSSDEANAIIMAARAHWFDGEEAVVKPDEPQHDK